MLTNVWCFQAKAQGSAGAASTNEGNAKTGADTAEGAAALPPTLREMGFAAEPEQAHHQTAPVEIAGAHVDSVVARARSLVTSSRVTSSRRTTLISEKRSVIAQVRALRLSKM